MSPDLPLESLSRENNFHILGYVEKSLNLWEKKDISRFKFNSKMKTVLYMLLVVSG